MQQQQNEIAKNINTKNQALFDSFVNLAISEESSASKSFMNLPNLNKSHEVSKDQVSIESKVSHFLVIASPLQNHSFNIPNHIFDEDRANQEVPSKPPRQDLFSSDIQSLVLEEKSSLKSLTNIPNLLNESRRVTDAQAAEESKDNLLIDMIQSFQNYPLRVQNSENSVLEEEKTKHNICLEHQRQGILFDNQRSKIFQKEESNINIRKVSQEVDSRLQEGDDLHSSLQAYNSNLDKSRINNYRDIRLENELQVLITEGNAAYDNNSYLEAIECCTKEMSSGPENKEVYLKWGHSLFQINKYDDAIDKYKKAINIDSKYSPAYTAWGKVLVNKQNYEEAIKMFREAIKHDSTDSQAYSNWGVVYLWQQRYEEAF